MENLKAKELRIGNYVEYRIEDELDSRKEWWEVTVIDSDDINWLEKESPESTDYRPIPITEEWLLNFGFKKLVNNFSFLENSIYSIEKEKKDWQVYYSSNDRMLNIKYIHQLQNLFYCLCGEELTFSDAV